MSLDLIWKLLVGVFTLGGIYTWVRGEIANLKRDLNGVGARSRNAEWERYKMQLVDLAHTEKKEDRLFKVEQFLKR